MKDVFFACIFLCLQGLPNGFGAEAATGSTFTAAGVESFVAYHNAVRKEVGVAAVEWSPDIAAHAQCWADRLALKGALEHRPAEGPWGRVYGENLAIDRSIFACAEAWHAEVKEYPAVEPIPADFASFAAGHYTQMVWQKTIRIGAGAAVVKDGPFKGMVVVACNYDPPGNMIGQTPY